MNNLALLLENNRKTYEKGRAIAKEGQLGAFVVWIFSGDAVNCLPNVKDRNYLRQEIAKSKNEPDNFWWGIMQSLADD